MTYRVFGSPFTLLVHQHVTYLRLKRLPFKLYCHSAIATTLWGRYHRCRVGFGTLTPDTRTCVQVWQLIEAIEVDATTTRTAAATTTTASSRTTSTAHDAPPPPLRLLNRHTQPLRHVASWATVVYAWWWLAKIGDAYRYVDGDRSSSAHAHTVRGFLRYLLPHPTLGLEYLLASPFRRAMQRALQRRGVDATTLPYMHEHFVRLCDALEAHFAYLHVSKSAKRTMTDAHHDKNNCNNCNNNNNNNCNNCNNSNNNDDSDTTVYYLLDTPYPTLADAAMVAVFAASFVRDVTPARLLHERYPHLLRYVTCLTRSCEDVHTAAPSHADATTTTPTHAVVCAEADNNDNNNNNNDTCNNRDDDDDRVPATLRDFFALQAEVMPFMVSECASLRAYTTTDAARELAHVTLTAAPWCGCRAYLLPSRTTLQSLMLIDNHLHTVAVRVYDIELALLAAREVCDDALDAFGRWRCQPRDDQSASLLVSNNSDDTAAAVASDDDVDKHSDNDDDEDMFATDAHAVYTRAGWQQYTRAQHMRHATGASPADGNRNNNDNSLAVMRSAYGQLLVRDDANDADTVTAQLQRLRALFARMHCPHYTLSTVMHGRRMYVAIVPEHEVAKVRATSATTPHA